MNINDSHIISRHTLFPLTTGEVYAFTDTFALAWIFSATLSAGLIAISVTRYSVVLAALSLALGVIWWMLTNLKRRR
jgi:hypothetical protein